MARSPVGPVHSTCCDIVNTVQIRTWACVEEIVGGAMVCDEVVVETAITDDCDDGLVAVEDDPLD